MSLARLKLTGRGHLHVRVVIEGLSIQPVTSRAMAGEVGDYRVRVPGLDVSGVSLGARADLRAARIEAEGIELKIKDIAGRVPGSRHGTVTRELWRRPEASTFLSVEAAPADTTLTVYSTAGFASAGVVHVGTEAIGYTGKTSTTFTGCDRGAWNTIAQRHFVADGEGLADARVTDRPQSVEGRRVYLYLYGDGDSLTGDGHLRWRGVCSTDLKWENGVWTVSVDPITRLLSQPIGSASGDEVRVRGIHYGSRFPWVLLIEQPSSGKSAVASVVGHFETELDFCAAATTAVSTAITDATISLGASGSLAVVPSVGGYRVVYTAHTSGGPHELVVTISPRYVPQGSDSVSLGFGTSIDEAVVRSLAPGHGASATLDVPAAFPRGAIGRIATYAPEGLFGSGDDWARIYLAAYAIPDENSALAIKDGEGERVYTVGYGDVASRSVTLASLTNSVHFDASTRFTVGAALGAGTVLDMLTNVATLSPDNANSGAMPLLLSDDITWTQDVVDALESSPLCTGRVWVAFDQTTLADVVEPELIALGAYMRISLTGQIEIDMLRPALSTDEAAWSIGDSQASPTIERGSFGTLGLVRYRYDYNAREDEWAHTLSVRDVQNASATRAPIETTVEQRSMTGSFVEVDGSFRPGVPPTLETIMRLAVNQFAYFGTDYSVINTRGDPRFMDARIGDTVAFSSSLLPDTSDGTSAVSARGVRIVKQSFDLTSGAVDLELILHAEAFAGYHFGALIASTSVVSGFIYDVTLEPGYSDGDATAHLFVGMGVRAVETDDATPSIVAGTVTSITSASVVRVTFVSAPSFTGEWALVAQTSTNIEAADDDARFAHVGTSTFTIDYASSSTRAKVFA